MDVRTFLTRSPDFSDMIYADEFASRWQRKRVNKGAHLSRQELPETKEFILLDGCLTSSICDQEGKEVCVGLYVAPVSSRHISRERGVAYLLCPLLQRLMPHMPGWTLSN
mgnify:CR=1 FL=1